MGDSIARSMWTKPKSLLLIQCDLHQSHQQWLWFYKCSVSENPSRPIMWWLRSTEQTDTSCEALSARTYQSCYHAENISFVSITGWLISLLTLIKCVCVCNNSLLYLHQASTLFSSICFQYLIDGSGLRSVSLQPACQKTADNKMFCLLKNVLKIFIHWVKWISEFAPPGVGAKSVISSPDVSLSFQMAVLFWGLTWLF